MEHNPTLVAKVALLVHTHTPAHLMEFGGSLPCSQEPANKPANLAKFVGFHFGCTMPKMF